MQPAPRAHPSASWHLFALEFGSYYSHCHCLSDLFLFFFLSQRALDVLNESSHFVNFGGLLRRARIDITLRDRRLNGIGIDWRSLCRRLFWDELKLRRANNPRIQDATPIARSGHRDGWIFWDRPIGSLPPSAQSSSFILKDFHSRI